jgi:hypothetical protein
MFTSALDIGKWYVILSFNQKVYHILIIVYLF